MKPKRRPAGNRRREEVPVPPDAISQRGQHRLALAVIFILPLVFYVKYLFGGQMLFGTDWLGAGGYQLRQFMAEYIRANGNVALWLPAILSGQPTVAAFFGDLFYPTQLFRLFIPVHVVWAWTFYLHVAVAGLGTYLFLRERETAVLPAMLGGIAYMFAGSLLTLTYAGHDGRLIGCALMPVALFFVERGMNRRTLLPFLLAGLMIALQLLSGHVQKVYYTLLMLVAWFAWRWVGIIRQERSAGLAVRLALFFAAGMALGAALSAVQYLPIFGNMPYAARGSERGYEYATSWSMPIRETLDLLSPHFSGILDQYHGTNPFKLHSEYMGLLPLLFAVVGIIRGWRRGGTKFFLVAFIVALLMAWGGNTPFYRLPYLLLPGLSKFRGPGMIFFLASFSLAALAAAGFEHTLGWLRRRRGAGPRVALLAAAALTVVMTLDIGLSLRLWDHQRGYIRGVPPPEQYFAPDEAIAFLKQDTSLYRVMPMNYERSDNGVLMGHGIQSAGGQLPNPLQSYQDFIGSGSSVMFQAGNLVQPNFMNLLNVRYVIGLTLPDDDTRYDERSRQAIRQLRSFFAQPRFRPEFAGNQYTVYRNLTALPRAFVVGDFRVETDRDRVLETLRDPGFDPARTALVESDPGFAPDPDTAPPGTVEVAAYDANRIRLSATLDRPGLLVLSENWHPAWKARVNGRDATVLRAFHTLRAVPLEPGRHEVEFAYRSPHYRAGVLVSLVALLLLLATIVVSVVGIRRRGRPA